MVLGQPATRIPAPVFLKYSARTQALVFESSPPMMTSAVIPSLPQFSFAFSNCSTVSSLVRPLPMMSKPPVLR